MRHTDPVQRFWARVEQSDGCWLWTGDTNGQGYGRMYVRRGVRKYGLTFAHRFSYELNVGPLSDGLLVCHRCDNPRCVRPDHLFLGTAGDNNRDMHQKGRHPTRVFKGWKSGQAPDQRKTHCRRGHEFTEANTYAIGTRRNCRTCKEAAAERYKAIRRR